MLVTLRTVVMKLLLCGLMAGWVVFFAATSTAQAQTLVIESWRTEDKNLWKHHILPVFHRQQPGITVKFAPTARDLYDQSLAARLDAGIAGDLISCRPFDASLALFQKGHLLPIDDAPALAHFPERHRMAWQTDDGRSTFCLPMASVMHGIFYNKALFERLRLSVPLTQDAWFAAMRRVRAVPGLDPLALGTADRWESHQLLFTNIGPNRWSGEQGRLALLQGHARLTDPEFLDVWRSMAALLPWLPAGHAAMDYDTTMQHFGHGEAAMRPGGSWEIPQLRAYKDLDLGVFQAPVRRAGDPCHVTDHLDIGMGINPKTAHPAAARTFLNWLASAEFTQLYATAAVGFYPLSDHPFSVPDPLAREMLQWRQQCQPTIRLNAQRLSRGEPDMEELFWTVNAMVINQQITPAQAATRLQREIDRRRTSAPGERQRP